HPTTLNLTIKLVLGEMNLCIPEEKKCGWKIQPMKYMCYVKFPVFASSAILINLPRTLIIYVLVYTLQEKDKRKILKAAAIKSLSRNLESNIYKTTCPHPHIKISMVEKCVRAVRMSTLRI
ncbi:Hypothetical predicted protein, partial [Mytilus galloprovincialis]